MRTIKLCAIAGTAVVGAVLFGSGTATASVPLAQPDQGRIGVSLSHAETSALADGPGPALLTMMVPMSRMGAGLQPDTQLFRDDHGGIHASLRQVIEEAAQHPDGNIELYVNLPGTHGGREVDVYQRWHRH